MNLLQEAWMPVRFRDGRQEWIAPAQLSDPAVVAFDADRADFNGALAQFAIGLLQTTSPAKNALQWKRLFESPPDEAIPARVAACCPKFLLSQIGRTNAY